MSIIIVMVAGVQLFGRDVKRPFELMNRGIEDRDTEVLWRQFLRCIWIMEKKKKGNHSITPL